MKAELIDRQRAIDVLDTGLWGVEWDKALATAMLKDLPPAERKGHWIGYAGVIGNKCSECGKWLDVSHGNAEMNYCPNCGARMDGE